MKPQPAFGAHFVPKKLLPSSSVYHLTAEPAELGFGLVLFPNQCSVELQYSLSSRTWNGTGDLCELDQAATDCNSMQRTLLLQKCSAQWDPQAQSTALRALPLSNACHRWGVHKKEHAIGSHFVALETPAAVFLVCTLTLEPAEF